MHLHINEVIGKQTSQEVASEDSHPVTSTAEGHASPEEKQRHSGVEYARVEGFFISSMACWPNHPHPRSPTHYSQALQAVLLKDTCFTCKPWEPLTMSTLAN